jgi:transcriptional regulator with PAS, ATPase and Fis domain
MYLSIYHHHEEIMQAPITDHVSIGRALNNDVVLLDAGISRNHALIQKKGQELQIINKSKNGLSVNGSAQEQADLSIKDEIKMGPYRLIVQKDQPLEDTVVHTISEKTQMFSYSTQANEMVTKNVWLEQTAPIARRHKLSKGVVTIGKDPQNDIVITDDYISSYHCKIVQKDGVFTLIDLGSTNGTLLNGQKVMQAQLQADNVIDLGKASLTFCYQQDVRKVQPKTQGRYAGMISQDPAMQTIFGLIDQVAPTDATVFVHGETGSGKELIARSIHEQSGRKHKPFLSVNCGAIAKELIESELFGHEKGAFTSADNQRMGLFEQAHGGTLFLDEVGELPLDLQPKLLRVLETGEIRRVGGNKDIAVDVRIVSATHRDLPTEVAQKRFREDLLYRLFVIPIELPALRARMGDLEPLVQYFIEQHAEKYQQAAKPISPQAMEKLKKHSWPGNIRELKNVIQRAIILSFHADQIEAAHVQYPTGQQDVQESAPAFSGTLEDMEKQTILRSLIAHQWNKTQTAKALGIAKSTLHAKINQYELSP